MYAGENCKAEAMKGEKKKEDSTGAGVLILNQFVWTNVFSYEL